MRTQRRKEKVGQIGRVELTFIHHRVKTDRWPEAAVWHRELSSELCDDLEGRKRGSERGDVCVCVRVCSYICVTYFTVQQELTQHCKAVTPAC